MILTNDDVVSTAIEMNRIGRDIEFGNGVAEHGRVPLENVPVNLIYAITGFATSDGSKFERPVYKRVMVCKVHPFAKRNKLVASSIGCRNLGRFNQMSLRSKMWGLDIRYLVIL